MTTYARDPRIASVVDVEPDGRVTAYVALMPSGRPHVLGGAAAILWTRTSSEPRTAEALASLVVEDFGIPPHDVLALFDEALALLTGPGFLQVSAPGAGCAAAGTPVAGMPVAGTPVEGTPVAVSPGEGNPGEGNPDLAR